MKSNNIKNKVSSEKRTGFIKIFTLLCFSFLSLTLIFSGFNFKNNIQYSFADSSTELTQEIQDYIINNGYYKSRNLFDGLFMQGNTASNFVKNRIRNENNFILEKGKTYTISTNIDLSVFRYVVALSSRPFLGDGQYVDYDSSWQFSNSFTFLSEEDYYFCLLVSKNSDENITVENISQYWFQLEEGSIATPYRPYEPSVDEFLEDNLITKTFDCYDYDETYVGLDYGYCFNSQNKVFTTEAVPFLSNCSYIENINFIGRASNGSAFSMTNVNVGLGQSSLGKCYSDSVGSSECNLFDFALTDNYKLQVTLLLDEFYYKADGYYWLFNSFYLSDIVITYKDLGYSQEEFDNNGQDKYEIGYVAGQESVDITIDNEQVIDDYVVNNNLHTNDDYVEYGKNQYADGKSSGYELGKTDALNGKTTFRDLVYSIIDAPFNVISSAFNFDIFGINVASFLMLIVSLLLVAFVLRRLL